MKCYIHQKESLHSMDNNKNSIILGDLKFKVDDTEQAIDILDEIHKLCGQGRFL